MHDLLRSQNGYIALTYWLSVVYILTNVDSSVSEKADGKGGALRPAAINHTS